MHQPGTPESLRHRAARYAIVVAIVLIVGGLFVQREFIADGGAGNVLAQPLELDAPAPDFTLETADGEFRLSDQRGKVVVLNFWASWCAPCRHEMPVFQETYEARAPAGDFMLVAVNVTADDARANADRFVEDFGLTFPVPFDVTRSVANAYGVRGLPATFFIDAAGILRARVYGPLPLDRLEDHIAAAGG